MKTSPLLAPIAAACLMLGAALALDYLDAAAAQEEAVLEEPIVNARLRDDGIVQSKPELRWESMDWNVQPAPAPFMSIERRSLRADTITINGKDGKPLVIIWLGDGRVEVLKNGGEAEAAARFWAAIAASMPHCPQD